MIKTFSQTTQMVIHPGKTFRLLLLGKPAPLAIFITLIGLVSFVAGQWAYFAKVWIRYPMGAIPVIGFQILIIALGLLVFSGLIHLTADMLGGGGRAMNMLYFLQISLLPFSLTGPCAFILKFLGYMDFYPIFFGLMSFWSLVMLVIGIGEIYRFSFLRSLMVILIPVCLSALIIAVGIITGWQLLPQVLDVSAIPY